MNQINFSLTVALGFIFSLTSHASNVKLRQVITLTQKPEAKNVSFFVSENTYGIKSLVSPSSRSLKESVFLFLNQDREVLARAYQKRFSTGIEIRLVDSQGEPIGSLTQEYMHYYELTDQTLTEDSHLLPRIISIEPTKFSDSEVLNPHTMTEIKETVVPLIADTKYDPKDTTVGQVVTTDDQSRHIIAINKTSKIDPRLIMALTAFQVRNSAVFYRSASFVAKAAVTAAIIYGLVKLYKKDHSSVLTVEGGLNDLGVAHRDTGCSICQEELKIPAPGVAIQGCGHTFHRACIDAHIQARRHDPNCPNCRKPIEPNQIGPRHIPQGLLSFREGWTRYVDYFRGEQPTLMGPPAYEGI